MKIMTIVGARPEFIQTAPVSKAIRNRRWTFWAIDLAGLVLSLGALIFLGPRGYADIAAAIFLGWGGIFTLHTMVATLAQSRDGDIESEVAKLRDAVYEKPKRLEVGEDGELVEREEWEYEEEAASKRLS